MSYIGIAPSTAAFPYDQFSGNGTTTAFTMSYAPASTTSMVVSISGVVQNPNTYAITGLTLTFSAAPPTGTNNIGVLYLGIPATSVTTPGNTAYLSSTQFTATAGQTTFTPSGTYQVGFINVIRNGSQLAPSDYTATNGTTVVLANACVAGDVVVVEVYNLVSVANALPSTGGTVTGATTFNSGVNLAASSGNIGIGTTTTVNKVTIAGGITLTATYEAYLVNAYYNSGWKYGANGFAWGIGNNFGGPTNGVTIAVTSVNAGGAGAALTWNPAFNVDSSGNVMVGTASAVGLFTATNNSASQATAFFSNTAASSQAIPSAYFRKFDNTSTTAQIFVQFQINNGAAGSGQINANGASAAAFGSYSDRRLKENITDLPSQLDNIMALRPVEFDYIESEGGGHQIGFIAQEVNEVYPDLVGERSDGMLTLTDMNKNDARLIKAIQELKAELDVCKAEIAALKGNTPDEVTE